MDTLCVEALIFMFVFWYACVFAYILHICLSKELEIIGFIIF